MAEDQVNEAMDKLNRGIQESKQMVQQQTMKLAQDFFGDSVEGIKQRIKDNRSTLEELPGQIPGGEDEAFQMLFQELMDNYETIEKTLQEAEKNVANLDPESLAEQGEIDASDAARREARELDLDLTEIKGTGSGGRIIVSDVVQASEEAVKEKAKELGVNVEEIEGTGSGGLVTVKDVVDFAGETGEQVTETAEETGEQDEEAAEEVAESENGSEAPKATNAAQRRAEEMGVDLSSLQGSGANGLITVSDVLKS